MVVTHNSSDHKLGQSFDIHGGSIHPSIKPQPHQQPQQPPQQPHQQQQLEDTLTQVPQLLRDHQLQLQRTYLAAQEKWQFHVHTTN
jgi:hypothetical protein